jgi:hypothetical protein
MRSPAKAFAMLFIEAEVAPFYKAVDIAVGYLVRSGYSLRQANDAACKHIVPLFGAGERRPMMLANRAISAIEKSGWKTRSFERHALPRYTGTMVSVT